jgi:hypothetical protein
MLRQVASSNESALYVAAWLGTLAIQPRNVDESKPSPSTKEQAGQDRMMMYDHFNQSARECTISTMSSPPEEQ